MLNNENRNNLKPDHRVNRRQELPAVILKLLKLLNVDDIMFLHELSEPLIRCVNSDSSYQT